MKLSTFTKSLLLVAHAQGITAVKSKAARRKLVANETMTEHIPFEAIQFEGYASDCIKAKLAAAELIQSASAGCGTAASSPAWSDQGKVMPNPTCLLLLCTAQMSGDKLIKDSCLPGEDDGIFMPVPDQGLALPGMCGLVPGLMPPNQPEAQDDLLKVFVKPGGSVPDVFKVDILANDGWTYGFDIQATITDAGYHGTCTMVDDKLVYVPEDDEAGGDKCAYQICYTGKFAGPADKYCDEAEVIIKWFTQAPTMSPTKKPCELQLDAKPNDNFGIPSPPMDECTYRPTQLVLKYNGGNCDQSYNKQEVNGYASCTGQDTNTYDYAIIEINGDYFQGKVDVGGFITLPPPSDGTYTRRLKSEDETTDSAVEAEKKSSSSSSSIPSDLVIKIYKMPPPPPPSPPKKYGYGYGDDKDGDEPSDPEPILMQVIKFHSSCSKPLFLQNKFGPIQIVGFTNDKQGELSTFVPFNIVTFVKEMGFQPTKLLALTVNDFSLIYGTPVIPKNGQKVLKNEIIVDTSAKVLELVWDADGQGANGELCDAGLTAAVNFKDGTFDILT